ncbi:hypothetical protein [Salinispira pacifica]|uniref:DUF5683 domain-containing protein n=1 Tax=Salinispira pacifica TaxID=1307761 RepID=V5WER8_9SPIO|nr:hypothetical protein [Salinispira pacifica]AHC13661.1 hypothetical protein L21SP2_0219 [Salinispira pacifica]
MIRPALAVLMMLLLVAPPALQGEPVPSPLQTDEQDSGQVLSGEQKMIAGLIMSIAGGGVTVWGAVNRKPLNEALAAYESFEGSGSIDDLEDAKAELRRAQRLHYIPFYTGLVLSSFGMALTLEGSFSLNAYEYGSYSPDVSRLIFSPGFTGLHLKF